MKTYIISLINAIKRQEFQAQQFKDMGLSYEIFNAVGPDDISKETYRKHYYDWQRPLKKEEVGCYFSHQKIWKKIIKDNKPALILEDDILLSKYTADLMEQFSKYKQFDLINLEACFRKKYIAKWFQKINQKHQLSKLYLNRSGAGAYVLYPSGAKKLLQYEEKKGIALADYHIHNCYALNSYQVEPALATQMIFAKRYKITTTYLKIPLSSIYDGTRPKSNYIFRCKRVMGQLRLGIRQLAIIFLSTKRSILLDPKHFTFNNK